jgi:hypothetical protein
MIAQVGIALFGVLAIFLVGMKGRRRTLGFVLGLAAQPFWFWTTYENQQWGIFALSIAYTFSWANGLRNCLKETKCKNP